MSCRDASESEDRSIGDDAEAVVLHVALEEGFVGDDVLVELSSGESIEIPAAQTRFQIGLADEVEFDVRAGPVTLSVAIPERSLRESFDLSIGNETWVGISAVEQLTMRVSETPFPYA